MRRRWWALSVGLAVLLGLQGVPGSPAGTTPTVAAPAGPDSLRQDLDAILADARLEGAHVGVVVRDPVTDEILYRRQARARATPASNAKLFTSVAALETLGPDYRFRTEVLATGRRNGPVLQGDLYLRGTGDPTMLAADYGRLAAGVAAAGITKVTGRLLADDSWFDDVGLGTGWMWNDEPYYYAAPVSALTVAPDRDYDAGTVVVRAAPGAPGEPVDVRLTPRTGVVTVDNAATTGPAGTESTLSITREHGTKRLVISGSLPAGSDPAREWISVPDPTRYAADVFRRALVAHGVEVGGVGEATVPDSARVLASHRSMTLADLMVPFLKLSNNGHAEALIKAMGREARGRGTWPAGLAVLDARMRELGLDPSAYRLVDGSGLSTMDAVAPGQIALLLDNSRARPWFRSWYEALPVAGVSDRMVGGTLRHRMAGTAAEGDVHAKTGSMTGVTALSGYVRTATDRPLVFSVLFNDFMSAAPHDLEDAIAVRLARHGAPGAGRAPTARVPDVRPPSDDPSTTRDESVLECSWVKAC